MRKRISLIVVTVFTVLSLAEAASAYYSPAKGRFLARDPIGERGGLNLVAFVRNVPAGFVDPVGLKKKSPSWAATQLLFTYKQKHFEMTYYRPAGVGKAFGILADALTRVNVEYLSFSSNEAEYSPALNQISIREGTRDYSSIVHELVHAVDDLNDWYIRPSGTNERQADALAYAVEQMFSRALLNFGTLEDAKVVKNCRQAQSVWRGSWSSMNSVIGYEYEYGGFFGYGKAKYRVTHLDVSDVKAKFGIRFSCSQLRPLYEEALAKRGITGTPASAPSSASPCPCKLSCDFGPDLSIDPWLGVPCSLWWDFQ